MGHGIVAIDIENTDLQERAIGRRADQHRQVVVHLDPTDLVANGVQNVRGRGLRSAHRHPGESSRLAIQQATSPAAPVVRMFCV
jgi:hypothetical protein